MLGKYWSKTSKFNVLIILLFLSTLGAKAWAPPVTFGSGVSINKEGQVFTGPIIYTPPGGFTVAIDQAGQIIHTWQPPLGHRIQYSKPLPNREVLARIQDDKGVRRIAALNAYSYPLWEFSEPSGVRFHHDHALTEDKNVLILCSRELLEPTISDKTLTDDCLMEVDIDGNIVWEWQTLDHFDEFGFTQYQKDKIFVDGGDWAHANSASVIPSNTSHTDPRFRPGNILVSYRHLDSIIIIDKDTGEIVWRNSDQTIGQHDAKMIPDNLKGGGRIMSFDNGMGGHYNEQDFSRVYSRVVEIDPVKNTVEGEYTASDSGLARWWFWSAFVSSAERLPNGNTLICEGSYGRIFEIDSNGKIVWEFVNPIFGLLGGGQSNLVYRAHKVSLADW